MISSLTGWLQIFRRILEGLDGFTQAETAKVMREAFASYDDFNFPKIIKLTNENYDYLDKQNDIVIILDEFIKSEFSYIDH